VRSAAARLAEFLLVGGLTPFLYPLAWLARRALGADSSELGIGFLCFYGAFVVNDPHFSVTYLLFYRDVRRRLSGDVWGTAQRIRYLVAGFVVPAVLAVWAAAALFSRSAPVLGWLIQLMFLLVGWHYVRQGFGVLAVLSARHGASLTSLERHALSAHAYAAWAYAWASPSDPGTEMEERGVVYRSFAHGAVLEHLTFVIFMATAVAVSMVLAARLRRTGRLLPAAPLLGYLSALWSWTVYSRVEPLVVYAIPALHSLQYLYFVWLLERNAARARLESPFAARPVPVALGVLFASAVALAWVLFHGVPETLDAAFFPQRGRHVPISDLGPGPVVAAVFVCVNVHHYFMDHVIWRRDNPYTRHLRESEAAPAREPVFALSATEQAG
jgi:hypothetical protein